MNVALMAIQKWLMFTDKLPEHERKFWAKDFVRANDLTVKALATALCATPRIPPKETKCK